MTTPHASLTGDNLHEPKGIDTASAGQVYIADGEGSGVWVDSASTIGLSAFTTGDLKPTIKSTADSGWMMLNDGTIGSASSGATRADGDTLNLYTLLWNNLSNTYAPVTGGRGVSAAADFAADKPIALLKTLGRVLGVAGAGSGLTSYALGQTTGENTHVLTTTELPSHNHSLNDPGHSHSASTNAYTGIQGTGGGGAQCGYVNGSTVTVNSNTTGITIQNVGDNAAHNNMQPSTFINWMIKL